ncbi:WD40 repeat protein [Arcicella aurantiaca]|uniref:WD40 repeat protein n=1 Tax=Arcicella aurantiaca TaxID=591202 RepID=A0A316EES3_9BACT|nr:OmpA family protein [Arcicella aurantiaca]PWK29067.1 WD40 repeat protein [Arcicella aurantiaca]
MPKLRKIGLTLTLATALLSNVSAQQTNPLLSDAIRHFDLRSYPTAIQKFEQVLKDGSANLSENDKLSVLLKLATSYKQAKDGSNAERVFRQAFASAGDLVGENAKSYLQFAQVLADNGKYKESQDFFDKYSASQVLESQNVQSFKSATSAKISQDVTSLTNGKGKYKVDFLDFNTSNPEFSPMYYKDGIVFCSGKGTGTSLMNDKGGYLDLFYLNDLSKVQGLGADGNAKKTKRITSGGAKSLGNDYYSRPTANDSKTLNFFGGTDEAVAKVKGQIAESEIFSKSLNTKFHEGPATFNKDFTQIIFTRNNFNEGEKGTSEDNEMKLKLYSAENVNGAWGEATELPFNDDEVSTAHPSLSKDGRYLYFASDREGGFGGMDIWVSEYKNGNWNEPKNLGKDINSKGVEVFPFVDERGNLYFSSDGWGGEGGLDMFFAEMKNGANANKPVALGEPFNSPNDDFGIITDGNRKTGYFSSDRKRGEDDDIYRFTREGGSAYDCREMTVSIFDPETKEPIADTDVEINPKGGTSEKKRTDKNGSLKFCTGQDLDYSMKIMKEGYVTNFVGYSTKGEADDEPSRLDVPLMKVQIVEPEPEPQAVVEKVVTPVAPVFTPEAVTKKKSLLKGIVKTEVEKTPIEGVLVTFKNDCDNTTQQVMTGPDGVYAFNMTDGCDYTLEVSKDGYGTNVNKIKKVKKGKAKEISLNSGLFKEGDLITMDNIYYDSNKALIRKDAARELDKLAATLQKFPSMVIELGSHTDSRGDAQDNMNLSEKRAQAAVDYIARKGIERNRMLAKGYGESDLVNKCTDGVSCTEAEHQKNRRTTVKIMKVRPE